MYNFELVQTGGSSSSLCSRVISLLCFNRISVSRRSQRSTVQLRCTQGESIRKTKGRPKSQNLPVFFRNLFCKKIFELPEVLHFPLTDCQFLVHCCHLGSEMIITDIQIPIQRPSTSGLLTSYATNQSNPHLAWVGREGKEKVKGWRMWV